MKLLKSLKALILISTLGILISSCGIDDVGDSGAAGFSPLPGGVSTIFISQDIGGREIDREVLIDVPFIFGENTSLPVVFAFHEEGGENDDWLKEFKWFIDNEQFIGIYPQGYQNSWNRGQERSVANDVEFVNSIARVLVNFPNITTTQMYAVGVSNGAMMVNKLGAETTLFRGIAPVGAQLFERTDLVPATNPVHVYQVNAALDEVVPYDGGMSTVSHIFKSAPESAKEWATTFNCDDEVDYQFIGTDTVFVYDNCVNGRDVYMHKIEGAGHGDFGIDTDEFFYRRIWNFFKER